MNFIQIVLIISLLGVLGEILRRRSVHTSDNDVITLIRLEVDLLDRSESLLTERFDLLGENLLRRHGRVNAACLDRDAEVTTVLDEHGSVQTEDSSLIRLGNIRENAVDHGDEHAIFLGMSCVFDNRDDISALLSHVDEVTAGALGELNSVNGTGRANQVRDVGHSSAGSTTEVENLEARLHVDVSNAGNDC